MIEFLKRWVLNIVTLVTFLVLLEIIIPSGKIKKFVNLISGFILIIAIITPFLNLLSRGIDLRDFEISTRNFIDRKEIEKKSQIFEKKQMKQVTELYRKKIIDQLELSAKQVEGVIQADGDVIINEDYSSNSYGEIKRVYLHIKLEEKKQNLETVAKIEKIKIDMEDTSSETEIKEVEGKQTGKEEGNNEIITKIEDKISELERK